MQMKSISKTDTQRPESPGNKRDIILLTENFPEECHRSYLAQTWKHCDNQFSHFFLLRALFRTS